jgi:Uma2 family endonuclease
MVGGRLRHAVRARGGWSMRQANDTLSREIVDSSLRHDRERKLPLYARFAIPEVWFIDIPARAVWVHREPTAGAYRTSFRLDAPYRISPLLLEGVELELGGVVG